MQNEDDKAANMIVVNFQNAVESAEILISTVIIQSAVSQQRARLGCGILVGRWMAGELHQVTKEDMVAR